MTIEIETGVPVPKARGKYPFAQLEVNQSFFVPGRPASALSGSMSNAKEITGHLFCARTYHNDDNTVKGTRIWRVK